MNHNDRWNCVCPCGYVVQDLSYEMASTFFAQHEDDEHAPRIEANR